VIGTAGSREKAETARVHGCDHAILYTEEDFAAFVGSTTWAFQAWLAPWANKS
jgi:NADPH2:quinone reductase